ncbi:MAG TPA: DUF4377 domain-containing protein [Bacteroidia bacterium]|nr:DUF4377 domain-containing protein [Bacteroidia bacterium]
MRQRYLHTIVAGIIAVVITGIVCTAFTPPSGDVTTTVKIEIPHYKKVSYGAFYKSLTLAGKEAEYIDGFDYEWGYNYRLTVEKTVLSQPMADGPSVVYKLIKVDSKVKVADTTTFTLLLEPDVYLGPGENKPALERTSDSTYLYFNEVTIACGAHCNDIEDRVLQNNKPVRGVFTHGSGSTILFKGFE